MYQKILVPLDGSSLSETSLSHVINLVKGSKAPKIILIRAREPMDSGVRQRLSEDLAGKLEEAYDDETREYLDSIARYLKDNGLTAETSAIVGPAAEGILDYARDNDVELIVMSSHGRTGIARWAFGSVTEKVLKQSDIPVLVIPHKSI
jgi:nucleotide-binding universal stress UspA family protein